MGEKHAIYGAAATSRGPRIPDAQHEVCHQGGRPGDNRARNPLRADKTHLQASSQCFSHTP